MGRHVALLRGINVGGKNKLPMRDLVGIFEDAGCADVRTYIQSGNVVFEASAATARRVPAVVAEAIDDAFGHDVPVVVRTAAELRKAAGANPFFGPRVDPKLLAVGFLAGKPTAARVRGLDLDRSPPDEFSVLGREIYLKIPNGMARTKLTNAWFDRQLATISTFRNWNTVNKLIEMSSG